MPDSFDRPIHTDAECARLLDQLLTEPDRVLALLPSHTSSERDAVIQLGGALWDIFSDNHSVVDAVGVHYHLGSFRGSAGFIAESINRRYLDLAVRCDYVDFYMGTVSSSSRRRLRPLYRWIFGELRTSGCDWEYSFPRLYLIDFAGALPSGDVVPVDPSESVRAQIENAAGEAELESIREGIDRSNEEALLRARQKPLPQTVAAYRDVYGVLPKGWPHPDM